MALRNVKTKQYDICIIGSGPAALTSAINFTNNGANVCLVQQYNHTQDNLESGETLSFKVCPYLSRLNIMKEFESINLPHLSGSLSSWGSEQMLNTSNLSNPSGIGWHFKRNEFESILKSRAYTLNIDFFDSEVLDAQKKNGSWEISLENNLSIVINTKVILVATGRKLPPNIKTQGKVPLDKLIGFVISFFDTRLDRDDLVRIDASDNGWFYSILNSSKQRILIYFTDGDLINIKSKYDFIDFIKNKINKLPSISTVLNISDLKSDCNFRKVSANSTFRKSFWQEEIFFCGDSAQTYDPLSSQGITTAIRDSLDISLRILECLDGYPNALKMHEIDRRRNYFDYLKNRYSIYTIEKRWHQNLFWKRRQDFTYIENFVKSMRN